MTSTAKPQGKIVKIQPVLIHDLEKRLEKVNSADLLRALTALAAEVFVLKVELARMRAGNQGHDGNVAGSDDWMTKEADEFTAGFLAPLLGEQLDQVCTPHS